MGLAVGELADGSVIKMNTIRLESITIGGRRLENLSANVSGNNATPLLGMSALKRLGDWRIDQEKNQLVLDPLPVATNEAKLPSALAARDLEQCYAQKVKIEDLDNRHKQTINDINKTGMEANKEYQTANTKLIDLKARLRSISVTEWNYKSALIMEQVGKAEQKIEKHKKIATKIIGDLNKETSASNNIVEQYNKKCSGTTYQAQDGTWRAFKRIILSPIASQQLSAN